jgi:hypothetical protein
MAFTPQSFLSNIRAKQGLARPNRFYVILNIPQKVVNSIVARDQTIQDGNGNQQFRDLSTTFNIGTGSSPELTRWLSLQCETAELPGKTLNTVDAKVYGPTYKVPYLAQYSDITLQFLCTNTFYERKLFDRWLENIIPNNTNNLRYPKGSGGIGNGYLTNVMIVQFDDVVKQIYAVELIDAFPIGIAAQPLTWGDDNFHRVSVQFSYQKFKTIYSGGDEDAVASEVFGGIQSYNRSVEPGSYNSVLYTDSGAINRNLPSTGVPVDLNLFNLKNQFTARYFAQEVLQPYKQTKTSLQNAFRF